MAADDAKDTSAIAPNASVVRQIIAVLRCDETFSRRAPVRPNAKRLPPVVSAGVSAGATTVKASRHRLIGVRDNGHTGGEGESEGQN